MTQLDLFAPRLRSCGTCAHIGPAIESGVRYCPATCTWQWDHLQTACANHSGDER